MKIKICTVKPTPSCPHPFPANGTFHVIAIEVATFHVILQGQRVDLGSHNPQRVSGFPEIWLMEELRRSPVDVGSLSYHLPRVLYIPAGFLPGFLNH